MKMVMNLSMIVLMFFFLLPSFSAYDGSSTAYDQYADYCSSIVPQGTPKFRSETYRFSWRHTGFFTGGGESILNGNTTRYSNSFVFRIGTAQKTDKEDVFKVEGTWVFQSPFHQPQRSPLYFLLRGFWSVSSGQLCMVGTGYAHTKGNVLTLPSVLKLSNFKNHSSITSLITGTLESLSSPDDKNYFEPISMLMLPRLDYAYSFVSGESMDGFPDGNGSNSERNFPFKSLPRRGFCSIIPAIAKAFNLQYTSDCISAKNCLPFHGYLPISLSLSTIECMEFEKSVRLLVEFHDTNHVRMYRHFNPKTTLVGEGLWDNEKNRLHVLACQFLDAADTVWSNARVGNCSTKLILRFPAVLSIRETGTMLGQILTNETANNTGYFETVLFHSTESHVKGFPGLRYEYTETDLAKKVCPRKKPSKREKYPSAHSSDMKFDISLKISKGRLNRWGSAVPISVGSSFYEELYSVAIPSHGAGVPASGENSSPVNISYKISIRSGYAPKLIGGVYRYEITNEAMEITAEGTYDAKTGFLCMVGCRSVVPKNETFISSSLDCEILLSFQLSPLNSNKTGGYVTGIIKSMRKTSDPLYFKSLFLSSAAYNAEKARQSIWRMDLEITIALISNTLACVFVGLQLYHVKKNPEVLSFISLAMLWILTMGHMIPLVLNFEALFLQNHDQSTVLLGSGGWLEANEVIVRIVTMVVFLMEFRLLQQTWSARSGDENQKDLWFADKMTLLVSVPMHAAGAFITLLVNWRKGDFNAVLFLSDKLVGKQQNSIWRNLRSYGGLVLDGFLMPQLLLNIFLNSKQNALCSSFYLGTTFIRLLPHAYDLYRNQSFARYDQSYVYATPGADFYSTAWDVVIPLGGLLFAATIYLQQRFGGRCILPQRFRELEAYDKVPAVSDS